MFWGYCWRHDCFFWIIQRNNFMHKLLRIYALYSYLCFLHFLCYFPEKNPHRLLSLKVWKIIFTKHLLSWLISHNANTAIYYRDMCISLFVCCFLLHFRKKIDEFLGVIKSALRENYLNTEFFMVWIFLYSMRIHENTDHEKTPYLDTFHHVEP